jgi:hypothetical protein
MSQSVVERTADQMAESAQQASRVSVRLPMRSMTA